VAIGAPRTATFKEFKRLFLFSYPSRLTDSDDEEDSDAESEIDVDGHPWTEIYLKAQDKLTDAQEGGSKRAKLTVIHKAIESLATVLRIEAPPLVSDPNEMQTQELLDQLEDFIVELGATPTCSIIYELKDTQRLTEKELTPLEVAKALAAAAPEPAGPSAVAKRGRTGGPTSPASDAALSQPGGLDGNKGCKTRRDAQPDNAV